MKLSVVGLEKVWRKIRMMRGTTFRSALGGGG
jgi:hypothetical protein